MCVYACVCFCVCDIEREKDISFFYQVKEEENEDSDLDGDGVEGRRKVIPEEDHDPVLHVVHGVERILGVDAASAKHVVHDAFGFCK